MSAPFERRPVHRGHSRLLGLDPFSTDNRSGTDNGCMAPMLLPALRPVLATLPGGNSWWYCRLKPWFNLSIYVPRGLPAGPWPVHFDSGSLV